MGATQPLVRIEAATLAGGEVNQDRYAYGDGWAFVLDGASSFDSPQSAHDGGWYAERLKNALAARLSNAPSLPTVDLVADAITDAASAHHPSEGLCPTSTIALARWNSEETELYALGDSYAVAFTNDGEVLTVTDQRLSLIGTDIRSEYQHRLSQGSGFDAKHRALLKKLQQRQVIARNRPGGYWIAGDNPGAASRTRREKIFTRNLMSVLLSTDGPWASGTVDWSAQRWTALNRVIATAFERELNDAEGRRHPRSKPHDDKTIVLVRFRADDRRRSNED